jgi:pimeloyl-ACP methyl ester carboxylesterase
VPYHLQLADAGYDVWLSNNRGTWYSQQHVEYDAVTDNEFWMYTWADMGLYDQPANIEKVKEQTGHDKIFYVGYSQGTIQMFYGLSHK